MNDAQSTIAGLRAQDCPGGGWNGMEIEHATVADCLANGVCGCIYGDAVQHIERLRAALVAIVNKDKRYDANCTSQDTGEDGPCGKIARAAFEQKGPQE